MSNIPEDIRKQIEDETDDADNPKSAKYWSEYGYQLASSEIESLRKEVADLKMILKENGIVELSCMVCNKTFYGDEPEMCCSGKDCGCMGMPIDPIVCSKECYDNLPANKSKTHNL